MSLKFGLGAQKKTTLPTRKPQAVKSTSAFGQDDSDDEKPKLSLNDKTPSAKPSKKASLPISQYGDLSAQRTHKKNAEKALDVDPSIYDYDAAYDAMQARAEAKKAADREKAEEGKAKYMENLLAAAEVRKRDHLRAQEKLLQRQREEEGEEFADKEKFVTGAYKRQQEENRLLEEAEKRKEQEEAEKKKKLGNQVFFRNLINEQDRNYMDDIAITEAIQKSGVPIVEPPKTKKTEAEVAKELNEKGASIEITDEGEIADKRQLLSAGLNVVAKPKSKSSQSRVAQSQSSRPPQFGTGFDKKSSRERQSRMVEAQMEQLLKRQADEETDEQKEKERAAKTRKTEGDVSSARERYLARKKAAEAAASKDSTS